MRLGLCAQRPLCELVRVPRTWACRHLQGRGDALGREGRGGSAEWIGVRRWGEALGRYAARLLTRPVGRGDWG